MPTIKLQAETAQDVLTTQLNSLNSATNSAAGAEFDNTTIGASRARLTINLTFASNPGTGTAAYLYATPSGNGTNFDDVSEINAELVATIPLLPQTTAQRASRRIELDPLKYKFFLRTDAGVALASSGSTVAIRPTSWVTA